jgi:GT2 family glycosyltransferase
MEFCADSLRKGKAHVGVVIIGRNEGERLVRCLESISLCEVAAVYVDSGSTDDSVSRASAKGAEVVELNMDMPFTAARARNAGFDRLLQIVPELEFVQFVDGDCELDPKWLDIARHFLITRADVAVVAGRLSEKFPQASVYNLLCDIEWSGLPGEAKMCGGLAMMRVHPFKLVNGFNPKLICGEEPELCSRLRTLGYQIWRLEDDMASHDANMLRISQWWVRAVRAGYNDAQALAIDSAPPDRRGLRSSLSSWVWGAGLPLCCVLAEMQWKYSGLALLLAYPVQVLRLVMRGTRSTRENCWYALFLVLGKFPELQGQLKYWKYYFGGKQVKIIEHK